MNKLQDLLNNQIVAGLLVAMIAGIFGYILRPLVIMFNRHKIYWSEIFDVHSKETIDGKTYYFGARRYAISNKSLGNIDNINVILTEKPQSISFDGGIEYSEKQNPDKKYVITIHNIESNATVYFLITHLSIDYSSFLFMPKVESLSIKGGRCEQVFMPKIKLTGRTELYFKTFVRGAIFAGLLIAILFIPSLILGS